MDKDFGKIKKNDTTDIIIRADDFGGKVGLTIREFTTSDRYTGFTKSGTRIPLDSIDEFKNIISKIEKSDVESLQGASSSDDSKDSKTEEKEQPNKSNANDENQSNSSNSDEIKEEIF